MEIQCQTQSSWLMSHQESVRYEQYQKKKTKRPVGIIFHFKCFHCFWWRRFFFGFRKINWLASYCKITIFYLDWQVDTKGTKGQIKNKVKCPWHYVLLNLEAKSGTCLRSTNIGHRVFLKWTEFILFFIILLYRQ